MEDEEEGLLVSVLDLLGDESLVLAENLGLELDVSGLVDTVNVSERGGDREVGRDRGEGLVDLVDVRGLGVEGRVVDRRVVDSVLLSAGDSDLHLEPLVHLGHSGEVLGAGGNVLLLGLLREVEHVGREEGNAVLLVVGLVSVEHAVEPGEELVGAVVGVENDGDTVEGGDSSAGRE